jgi:hypothetical protein
MTETTGERLRNRLPPATYRRSEQIGRLLAAEAIELDSLLDALVGPQGLIYEFISTMATWTLDLWEEQLGLPVGTSLSVDERRARLHARWQTYGTTTPNRIHLIANSFENGTVEVVEYFEIYTVQVIFADIFGAPPSLDAVYDALRTALPAHLVVDMIIRYVTWDLFDERAKTWDEWDADAYTWDEIPTSPS